MRLPNLHAKNIYMAVGRWCLVTRKVVVKLLVLSVRARVPHSSVKIAGLLTISDMCALFPTLELMLGFSLIFAIHVILHIDKEKT